MGKSATKKNRPSRLEPTVSVADAANEIGCHIMTVNRLIAAGDLSALRLTDNGWWKISRSSLDAYLSRLAAQLRSKGKKRK